MQDLKEIMALVALVETRLDLGQIFFLTAPNLYERMESSIT